MTSTTPKRGQRGDPGNRRVTPRELLGLRFIAELQPVTTSAYRDLLGMSPGVAYRSLRKLRDLGLLDVHVFSQNAESRFTLAPATRLLLARAFGDPASRWYVPPRPPLGPSPHHESVVRLATQMHRAAGRSGRVAHLEWIGERSLRKRLGGAASARVPDSVALLDTSEGRTVALSIEVDAGTENPNSFVAEKARDYADLWQAGHPLCGAVSWVVLVVAPTVRRRNRLARAIWQAGVPEGLFLFGAEPALSDRNVLTAEGWLTPRSRGQEDELVPEDPLLAALGCADGRPDDGADGLNARVDTRALGAAKASVDSARGVNRPGTGASAREGLP